MKGNPAVLSALQEAINLEATCSLQYLLDARNVKRFGLKLSKGLKVLHEQCESFMKQLTDRSLFLGGTVELKPAAAGTRNSVTDILTESIGYEEQLIARYAAIVKLCYEAGDMSNFHFFQHLVRWHGEGDRNRRGHLDWLQKQAWQLNEFGETDYEETKV